jgi:transposase
MKRILKQVVGIDIAQKELVVCLGTMDDSITSELYARHVFVNSKKGFIALLAWVKKQTNTEMPVQYVMEATGVYHEQLAYFLYDQGFSLTIVLPSKISNYSRTLDVKTVTDKTASEAITRFGLERKLDDWKRPSPLLKELRQLTRERDQLVQQRTIAKNQLHAERSEAEPKQSSIQRTITLINLLNNQEKEIRQEITLLIKSNEELKTWINRLCTLPGIGQLTAATILAETNGFELIRNKKQLVSYAGLDIREKQSGTSIKGKPRISKRGNKFLRKAMHMPALAAIRHDERFKAIFARSVSKHGIKMKAVVPIQRKLLEMAYILFKTQTDYDKNYLQRDVEVELSELKN